MNTPARLRSMPSSSVPRAQVALGRHRGREHVQTVCRGVARDLFHVRHEVQVAVRVKRPHGLPASAPPRSHDGLLDVQVVVQVREVAYHAARLSSGP